ncbi:hypothetical protein BRARA_J02541 [Brassica rapa]|uniref:Uncharacterized protein n=1 Tax=Brassica campestris TaxID=3711 RepID=A0A397XY07_BRACM|nr:hypothetical protein BRARA_J02541 [Brassica rapa]
MDHKTNTTLLFSLLFFITHLSNALSKDLCNENDKNTLLKIKKSLNNPYHLASYNRLCGPIPTGGSLQRFDSYIYFHNKCLCGAPLDSCK